MGIVFSLCSQFFSICCRMGVVFLRQVPSQMRQVLFRMRPLSFRMRAVSPLMRGAKTKWIHGNREVLHCYVTPAYQGKRLQETKEKDKTSNRVAVVSALVADGKGMDGNKTVSERVSTRAFRSGAWLPFTAASGGLLPFTVRRKQAPAPSTGTPAHGAKHQHPVPVYPAPSTSTRHPGPSTLSPPRAQPAPSAGAHSPQHALAQRRHRRPLSLPRALPAPSTGTVSPPRVQPAHSTSTSTGNLSLSARRQLIVI